jgi:hypothetical protein
MPVFKRFSQCRLCINYQDHNPPHFHVLMNDRREAWVKIDNLEIIHGKVTAREIPDVLDWARANQQFLAEKFEEFQR